MKRCVFLLLLIAAVVAAGSGVAYAETYYPDETKDEYIKFTYTSTNNGTETTYDFLIQCYGLSISSDSSYIYYVDSEGNMSSALSSGKLNVKFHYEEDGTTVYATTLTGSVTLSNDVSIDYFEASVAYQYPISLKTAYIKGTCTSVIVEEPSVTPEVTPEVTPDPTPEPTPTVSPTPTPTNTPAPTPTPTPLLELHAYVDNDKAVAEYKTSGCIPIKSIIEFYEVDRLSDSVMKLDGENFLSGAGTRSDNMEPGKWYRYKLTYIFERDGVIFERYIWSEDLTITDKELDDYNQTGKITNFRTLILFIWNDLMDLEIPVEGYHVKIRSLFLWIMIAGLGIWFYKKWNGG